MRFVLLGCCSFAFYDQRLFERVKAELKQQILKAVESPSCLPVLEDLNFGFADIAPIAMLTHLKETCGLVTPDDVEKNRNLLSAEWNLDEPIENIWLHIHECQAFARPIEPITDGAAMHLTLAVFEQTGGFASAVEKWRDKSITDHTLPNFTFLTATLRTKSASATSQLKQPVSMVQTKPTSCVLLLLPLLLLSQLLQLSSSTMSGCAVVMLMVLARRAQLTRVPLASNQAQITKLEPPSPT